MRFTGMEYPRVLRNLEEDNQFDPDFRGLVLSITAISLAAILVLELFFLSTFGSAKCPGWQVSESKDGMSLWILWVFGAIWTLNIGYHAVTWRRFSRKILDQLEGARQTYVPGTSPTWFTDPIQFKAMCTVKNNINRLILVVSVGSAFPVALPVFTALKCI